MIKSNIHPTAIIDKKAQIDASVIIGAYAIIGPKVTIDKNTQIHSHVVITGNTTIGKDNQIFPHAVLGGDPQDKNYRTQDAKITIGDSNTIREFSTIHSGITSSTHPTIIGNGNYLMAYSHIAHNCLLQNDIVIVNNVQVAGHVEIHDGAMIGACSGIHQFVQIGSKAMIAAYSAVLNDVPPAVMAGGQPARAFGLNRIGLKRSDYSKDRINHIKDNFRLLFQKGFTINKVLEELASNNDEDSKLLLDFINNSKRGIISIPRRKKIDLTNQD